MQLPLESERDNTRALSSQGLGQKPRAVLLYDTRHMVQEANYILL